MRVSDTGVFLVGAIMGRLSKIFKLIFADLLP